MYTNGDFQVPNIANAPIDEDKVRKICHIFGEAYLGYQDLDIGKCCEDLSVSEYTFVKMLNHACKVGVLENEKGMYHLSGRSREYVCGDISYGEYIEKILADNEQLWKICSIIGLLLSFFDGKMKKKTISYIFCIVSTGRRDKSAFHSVSRNLATIYNMLFYSGCIYCEKGNILLREKESVQDLFENKQVITVNHISKVLNNYFEDEVTEEMLSVIATFEYERYIWSKSSLYKNQGEIRNMDGDYIMTVMKK